LTIVSFIGDSSFNILRHVLLPFIGLLVNLGIVIAAGYIGLGAGGIITQASLIALGIAGAWFLVSVAYYFIKRKSPSSE